MTIASIRKLEFDDIQLLRYWRNLDHVRARLIQTDLIETTSQRFWFENLDSTVSKYFIYSLGARDIGSANVTKIDYVNKTFDGGIFCGDQNFLRHWINVWACLKIYDYSFFELDLEVSFASILKNNDSALSLNKSLGYIFTEELDDNVSRFVLTKKSYIENTGVIKNYLQKFVKQTV
jgi:hypothetical protein